MASTRSRLRVADVELYATAGGSRLKVLAFVSIHAKSTLMSDVPLSCTRRIAVGGGLCTDATRRGWLRQANHAWSTNGGRLGVLRSCGRMGKTSAVMRIKMFSKNASFGPPILLLVTDLGNVQGIQLGRDAALCSK